MADRLRVMIERGKKKRVVACAFDWPGWDRSGKTAEAALAVLEAYRPRYARLAELAGYGAEFAEVGAPEVVDDIPGTGMTDFYGVSGRPATAEQQRMSGPERERKIALLRASWAYLDSVAARVPLELTLGPRGGGRDRDRIVRHVNGAEIDEFAPKVGIKVPLETRSSPTDLAAYREAFCEALLEHDAAGLPARTWTVQALIRRCAWHMLDHAWEMEDRDPARGSS